MAGKVDLPRWRVLCTRDGEVIFDQPGEGIAERGAPLFDRLRNQYADDHGVTVELQQKDFCSDEFQVVYRACGRRVERC